MGNSCSNCLDFLKIDKDLELIETPSEIKQKKLSNFCLDENQNASWLQEYVNLKFDEDKIQKFFSKNIQEITSFEVAQFMSVLHFSFYRLKFFKRILPKIKDKQNLQKVINLQIFDVEEYQKYKVLI
jgi:hypothetical protein